MDVPALSRRQRIEVLAGLITLSLVVAGNEIGVAVALPEITDDLGGGHIAQLWLVAAYMLPAASLSVVAGRLGDAWSPRSLLQVGAIVFVVASVGAAVAPSIYLLYAARVAQGLGAAMLLPAGRATALLTFDGPRLGHVLGLIAAAAGAGIMLSPALLGVVVTAVGWRWIFAANALLIPVATALATVRHPVARAARSRARRLTVSDALSALLFVLALGACTVTLLEGHDVGFRSPWVIAGLVVAAVSAAAFVRRERAREYPLVDMDELRTRREWTLLLGTGQVRFVTAWLATVAPVYLQQVSGLSPALSGVALVPIGVGGVLGRVVGGGLADQIGWRRVVGSGLAVSAAGMAIAAPVLRSGNFWLALAPLAIGFVGATAAQVASSRQLLHGAASDRATGESGLVATANHVLGLLGVIVLGGVAGLVAARSHSSASVGFIEVSMETGVLVAAALLALLALSVAALGRDDDETPPPDPEAGGRLDSKAPTP